MERKETGKTDDVAGKDGWKHRSFSSKLLCAAKNVTVEPLIGVFHLSMIMSNVTTQNLNLQKACRVNLRLDGAVCEALESKNATLYRAEEVTVQHAVAGMMVWQNLVQYTVPCALVVFIGSWSDRNRKRKPFMLLPIFGELVRNVGLIACVYFFHELPMEVAGVVESVPPSVTGGVTVLFLAVFAYVGDISTVENRTFRVGLVSLFVSITFPIGAALSGVLFRKFGFYGVYGISTALYLFCFVYGTLVIKDVDPSAKEDGGPPKTVDDHSSRSALHATADFFDLKHIKEAFQITFKRGNSGRRVDILLLLVVVVIVLGPLFGEQSLMYLLTRVQFNWNEVDYSFFSTYYFVCNLIGIGFTLYVFVKIFGIDDKLIGAIGCLSKGLGSFVYAFAPTEFIFYLGSIVDIFHGTALVALRSILSKLVPANELGQVLAVFSLVETVIPAIFRPLYSVLYQRTLHTLPGAYYIFGGTINLPGVLIFLWMYKKQKRNSMREFSEEKQALSPEQHNQRDCKIRVRH